MDQAPSGAQAPDEAQPSNKVPEAQQSPLGMPLSQASANSLAENRLQWHLMYWLSVSVLAILLGQDPALTDLLIEIEHDRIADLEFKRELRNAWERFHIDNRDEYQRQWTERTVASPEAKGLLGDIDRMLLDKAPKTKTHLFRLERLMVASLRDARVLEARAVFDHLGDLYEKLKAEETADGHVHPGHVNDESNISSMTIQCTGSD